MNVAAPRRSVRPLLTEWLGRVPYDDGLTLQKRAVADVAAGGEERLFLLEHEPVYTLGRNARSADVLLPAERAFRPSV